MRVLRFTPKPGGELGNDPLFGLREDDEKTICRMAAFSDMGPTLPIKI